MDTTDRKKISSGDKFSFPITPIQDEFEFSSASPSSPNSPADHLFHNGRLLPHTFRYQPSNTSSIYSRSTSRASSVSSKDSLLSSRSNSINSSRCSSARTSSSDASELKLRRQINRGTQQFGASKRWQFIAPSPVLSQEFPRRRKQRGRAAGGGGGGEEKKKTMRRRKKGWFGRRFFRWFASACKECHAIEPARRKSRVVNEKILD